MALSFPNPATQSPVNTFSPTSVPPNTVNGVTYIWNGTAWTVSASGGGGSGTVTAVSGTAPIVVANGTTTPAISITAASDTAAGAIEIATLAEAATGTDATRASTPSTAVPKSSADMAGAAVLPSGTAATAPAGAAGYARIATDLGQLTFFANGAYFPVGFGAGGVTSNTAVGLAALDSNTTGTGNTAFGQNALTANTTGVDNTATGRNALCSNTGGIYLVAVGAGALANNSTADANTAVGYTALFGNTTGAANTATGSYALRCNQIGSCNTAFGANALYYNTTGGCNTATGANALCKNTTGTNNTATGANALAANVDGNQNAAFGTSALAVNTAGGNTAVGFSAMVTNGAGSSNTAVGRCALFGNTSGDCNVALGFNAGCSLTTGNGNTIIGANIQGSAGASNCLLIGAGGIPYICSDGSQLVSPLPLTLSRALPYSFSMTNQFAAGIVSLTANTPTVTLGTGGGLNLNVVAGGIAGVQLASGGNSWAAISDESEKTALNPITGGLEKVASLRAVTGRYVSDEEDVSRSFLIAQDVQEVLPEAVHEDPETEKLRLSYTDVIPLLVSALHDAKDRIEALEAEVAALKGGATPAVAEPEGATEVTTEEPAADPAAE
jgi:hypothetical protein